MQDSNTKYHVSKEEIELLVPALKNYFSYPQRTIERSNIVHEVVAKLSVISQHWNPGTVRKWFINNMQQYVKNYLYASTPQPIIEEEKFPGCPEWMNYYLPRQWYYTLPKNIQRYYDRIEEKTLEMRRNQAQFQNVLQPQAQAQAQFPNTQSVQLHQQPQAQAQVHGVQTEQIQQQSQTQAQVHRVQALQLQPQAQFQNTQSVQLHQQPQAQAQVHGVQAMQIQQQSQFQNAQSVQLHQQPQAQAQVHGAQAMQIQQQSQTQAQVHRVQALQLQPQAQFQNTQSVQLHQQPQAQAQVHGVQTVQLHQQPQAQAQVHGVQTVQLHQQPQPQAQVHGAQAMQLQQQSQTQAQFHNTQSVQLHQQPQAQAQVHGVQAMQLQPQAQFQNAQSVQLHQQPQAQVYGVQAMQLQQQAQFPNTQSVQLQPQAQAQAQFPNTQSVQLHQQPQAQAQVHGVQTEQIQQQSQTQAQVHGVQALQLQPQAQFQNTQSVQLHQQLLAQAQVHGAQAMQLQPQAQFQNAQSVQLHQQLLAQAQVHGVQTEQIQQQSQTQAQVHGVQALQLQPQAQFQNTQSVQLQPQAQAQFQNTQSVQLHQQSQPQVQGAQAMQLQQQSQTQTQFQNAQSVQLHQQLQAQVHGVQTVQIQQQPQTQFQNTQPMQIQQQPQAQFQNTQPMQLQQQPQAQFQNTQPMQLQQQPQALFQNTQPMQLQQQPQALFQNIQPVQLKPQAQIYRSQPMQLIPQEQLQFQSTQPSQFQPQVLVPQCQPPQVLTTPYHSMINIATPYQFQPERQNQYHHTVQDDIQSYNQMMQQTKWQSKMNNSNYFNFSQKRNTQVVSSNDINLNDEPTIYETNNIIVQLPELSKEIRIQDPPQNELNENTRETPPELVNCFLELNNNNVDSLDLLLSYVHDISIAHGCPFVAKQTGPTRSTQIFACSFHETQFQCKACIKLYYDDLSHKVYIEEMEHHHTHCIGQVKKGKTRNSLPYIQKLRIQNATNDFQTAQAIKEKEGLVCSKDILFGARRKALKKLRDNEMKHLLQVMLDYNNWTNIVIIDENNKFRHCYCIHNPVLYSTYSNDVCIIDDTSCTNYYGKPLLSLVVEDENKNNQLLSFAIMDNRCKPSFIAFFSHLKKFIGDIRVFVTDRNQTQIEAIEEIWPHAHIMYCLRHIGKNIGTNVSAAMKERFDKMVHKQITEKELLDDFEKYLKDQDPKSQGYSTISNLLSCKHRWLPSITATYCHRENSTSNRVEGFFGKLKNFNEHRIKTLGRLVRSIYISAANEYTNSINTDDFHIKDHILSPEHSVKVGSYALERIQKENDILENLRLHKEYGPTCCDTHVILGLPCRHLLFKRMKENNDPLLTINDIHPRWLHSYQYDISKSIRNRVSIKKIKLLEDGNWTYSACIDRFERYFSVAKRSKAIQKILKQCLLLLQNEEQKSGESSFIIPPDSLLISGRSTTFPRNNVDKPGAPKLKKPYKKGENEKNNANRCTEGKCRKPRKSSAKTIKKRISND